MKNRLSGLNLAGGFYVSEIISARQGVTRKRREYAKADRAYGIAGGREPVAGLNQRQGLV